MVLKDINYLERKKLIDGCENKIICFLDILGISKFIEKNRQNDASICEIYRIIQRLINIQFSAQDWLKKAYYDDKVVFSSLSDSIIISFPISDIGILLPYVLRFVASFQFIFLSHGLPIRGVITTGKIYHHRNSQLIFGQGLVKAYECEKKSITSPRVIIDDKLIKKFNKYTVTDFEQHIATLKKAKYIEDINLFFNQLPVPMPKSVKPSLSLLLDCHKEFFKSTITLDTWHNSIYQKMPVSLDKDTKTITIFFDAHRVELMTHLKKSGGFKFGNISTEKVIKNNLAKFTLEPNVLLKWQYLEAQHNSFSAPTSPQ